MEIVFSKSQSTQIRNILLNLEEEDLLKSPVMTGVIPNQSDLKSDLPPSFSSKSAYAWEKKETSLSQ
ncbi:2046_t:CDS:2 [Diversispora eburnea]|uniref:2046_t:CDS:1 n=1 Tax=Diversispora eburnea TaxID=1213867 RepID=A0A9N8Z8R2_9GLOM|nr:2046_t:CDS:2 [Diversispora eburnea]